MVEHNALPMPEPRQEDDVLSEGGLRAPPGLSTWRKCWWWFDFLILVKLARLRFIGILVAIGLLIVYWNTLVARYEKWTRTALEAEVASSDTEYFCPMHPQVVTNDPREKCPICFMNLSRRKKGENQQEALPAGVVTRLQLSPYRVVAAGIQTAEVAYEPLAKEIVTVGSVEFDERGLRRIAARVKGRIDKLYVNVTGETVAAGDRLADLYSPELVVTVQNLLDAQRSGNRSLADMARQRLRLWDIDDKQIKEMERTGQRITHVAIRSPIGGHVIKKYQVEGEYVEEGARLYDVADLTTAWIEAQVYENDLPFLELGLPVSATIEAIPNRTFPGKLTFIHPHLDAATRTVRVRFNMDNPHHILRPGMFATVKIEVPAIRLDQPYLAREGRVLAVPETAVIHTGTQKIVFRQEAPTTYDAIQVELGPPMAGPNHASYYPVLQGLEAGARVVTVGSYLLDAETRVSAAAGSIYYGGSDATARTGSSHVTAVRPSTPEDLDVKVTAALAKLSTPDRRLAEAQRFCPILPANRLGSMGTPVKVLLKGQPVFLCCKACEAEALAQPGETLAKVEQLLRAKGQPPVAQEMNKEAKIKAALAKLSDADRRLAEAQKYCAIEQDTPLGSMGTPVKVMVKGQPVVLCCKNCKEEALAQPEQTLAALAKLKAKTKGEPPRP